MGCKDKSTTNKTEEVRAANKEYIYISFEKYISYLILVFCWKQQWKVIASINEMNKNKGKQKLSAENADLLC